MNRRLALCAFAVLGLAASASAQNLAGDPVAGKAVAVKWCASCHDVTPEQKTAQAGIPSFMTVARLKGVTLDSLIAIQTLPHPPMLDLNLSRKVKRDIAAYILSLKTR
ncbi:MAG TPA: cytochrome c [Rhizobiales bacterium]|nr:cytochrome c [Hyphomicrobiales bacterium]